MMTARVVDMLALLVLLATAAAQSANVQPRLPAFNRAAGRENPLRGWTSAPLWTSPEDQLTTLTATTEYYYISLHQLMTKTNNVYDFSGMDTNLEPLLAGSASRNKHAIIRVICVYPGEAQFKVPQFLVDGGLQMVAYTDDEGSMKGQSGQAPNWADENLILAFEALIAELGRRYDDDNRVGFVQAGLLGMWGEWHTAPHSALDPAGPNNNPQMWIPDATKTRLANAYAAAFTTTKVMMRYPADVQRAQKPAGTFGYHDDSFARYTLSGAPNGGVETEWHFWPSAIAASQQTFWRTNVMGGEVRPELQPDIFNEDYPAGEEEKQDFDLCARTTHTSQMLNAHAFSDGYTGTALGKARASGDKLGYAFVVSSITYTPASQGTTAVTVTVTQKGIAPFYYPLSLKLSCAGQSDATVTGVQAIIDEGDSRAFSFSLPAEASCLSAVSVGLLQTAKAYTGRPVKFAQGVDGTVVVDLSAAITATADGSLTIDWTDTTLEDAAWSTGYSKTSSAASSWAQLSWLVQLAAVVVGYWL